jgi:predicted LPLAT superfamily acyltransferase
MLKALICSVSADLRYRKTTPLTFFRFFDFSQEEESLERKKGTRAPPPNNHGV